MNTSLEIGDFFILDSSNHVTDSLIENGNYSVKGKIFNRSNANRDKLVIKLLYCTRIGNKVIYQDKLNINKKDSFEFKRTLPAQDFIKPGRIKLMYIIYKDTTELIAHSKEFTMSPLPLPPTPEIKPQVVESIPGMIVTNGEFYSYKQAHLVAGDTIHFRIRIQRIKESTVSNAVIKYNVASTGKFSFLSNTEKNLSGLTENDTLLILDDLLFKIDQPCFSQTITVKVKLANKDDATAIDDKEYRKDCGAYIFREKGMAVNPPTKRPTNRSGAKHKQPVKSKNKLYEK